jgi:hypothetical protein
MSEGLVFTTATAPRHLSCALWAVVTCTVVATASHTRQGLRAGAEGRGFASHMEQHTHTSAPCLCMLSYQVGTEQEPFLQQAVITLYGNIASTQLPTFGSKV